MPLEDFEVIQCAKKASVVLAAEAAFAGGGVSGSSPPSPIGKMVASGRSLSGVGGMV